MQRLFFGFDFDYEEGNLTTNRQEQDMLEFIGKLSLDPNTLPPYHMIKSVLIYHKNEITRTDAIARCRTKKYIMMYCNALCRKKAVDLFGIEPQDKTATDTQIMPSVATSGEGATKTRRNMFEPTETLVFEPTVDLETEPWVNIKEISERLNASIDMVLIWIRNCGLPAEKMGGVWYFKLSKVGEWWNSIPKVISYNNLFKLLIDKDITGKDFIKMSGLSSSTLYRMKKEGGPVQNDVMHRICSVLECEPKDIYSLVPEKYNE